MKANVIPIIRYLPDPGARRRWLDPWQPLGARDRYRAWQEVKWLRGRNYPEVTP